MSDTPPDLTPEQVSPEPAPKKRIIRKTKSAAEAPVKPQTAAEVPGTEQDSSPAPRKRTIRKKVAELADDGMESVDMPGKKTSRKSSAEIPVEEAQDVPARPRRGRPRKKPVEEVPETDGSAIVSGTEAAVKPVRRRAAKAVAPENGDSAGPEAEIAVHAAPAEPASDSSDSVPEQPAEGRPKVIRQRFVRKPREQEPEADASVPSIKVVQEGAADFSEDAAREPRRTNEPQRQRFDRQNRRNNNDRFNKNRNNRQDGRNGRNGNDRVKNRWNNNQEGGTPQNSAPRELAPPEPVDGLLEITNKGFGFLRKPDNDFDAFAEAVYVPQDMIRRFGLRPAVWVHGQACRHDRGILLTEIASVNGVAPEKARKNPHFEELKAVNPNKRISFETRPERYTTRTLDLIAPIGRGQRGLIVSPPRAGKTTLLQHMAEADTKGAEIRTSALVMLNRPGSTKGNAYRNPLLSILTEFGEIKDGKNPDWASVINQQYAKVEVDEYMDIDRLSCEKLEEARKALLEVLSGGVTVPYDEFRTAVTTPTPHVTIGGTDFLTEKQYRNCIVKPDGCDSLSVWPGGPLDR